MFDNVSIKKKKTLSSESIFRREQRTNYNCDNDTLRWNVEVTIVFFICRELNARPLLSAALDSMMGLTEVSGGD